MFSESTLDPSLIQAYLETDFNVHGDQTFTLRIGVPSLQLLVEHKRYKVTASAFLTAYNPYSRQLDDDENHRRNLSLVEELTQRGLIFLPGVGQHPSNQWQGEASFLIFGLDMQAAKALGRCFEQNAIVWCANDGVPQLILIR